MKSCLRDSGRDVEGGNEGVAKIEDNGRSKVFFDISHGRFVSKFWLSVCVSVWCVRVVCFCAYVRMCVRVRVRVCVCVRVCVFE